MTVTSCRAAKNLCGLLVAALLLSGCLQTTNTETPVSAGVTAAPPDNWREIARQGAKKALFDPYTARDVEIAAPIPASSVFDGGTLIPHRGWMVCMRANAKNRFGAYTGLKPYGLLIEDNEVGVVVDQPITAAHHCDGRKYEPFTL